MTASAFLKPSAFGSRGGLDRVERASSCRLDVSAATWDYARDNRDEIERHWQRRSAESPAMFNGAIYLMHAGSRRESAPRERLCALISRAISTGARGVPRRLARSTDLWLP